MKKLISVLCVLAMVIGICAAAAVSTSAADAAKTIVDVKKGDKVTYQLTLSGVELPIVGCDYSVYFDPAYLKVDSVADFNDKTNEDEWLGMINPDLEDEVRGNWSILSGVKFDEKRNFVTVNFSAIADGKTNLSYYVRYMYDNNIFNSEDKPQIVDYLFECNVKVNDQEVLTDAQPELNLEEPQDDGLFVNSITGDSKDADVDIPGTVIEKTAANSNITTGGSNNDDNAADDNNVVDNGGGAANNGGGAANNGGGSNNAAASSKAGDADKADGATTADNNKNEAADNADVKTTGATAGDSSAAVSAPDNEKSGTSPVVWIIIALVVLGGGGAAAYFFTKKKPETDGAAPVAEAPKADDEKADNGSDDKE